MSYIQPSCHWCISRNCVVSRAIFSAEKCEICCWIWKWSTEWESLALGSQIHSDKAAAFWISWVFDDSLLRGCTGVRKGPILTLRGRRFQKISCIFTGYNQVRMFAIWVLVIFIGHDVAGNQVRAREIVLVVFRHWQVCCNLVCSYYVSSPHLECSSLWTKGPQK